MRKEKGAILFAMIPLFLTIFIATGVYVFNSANATINTASSQMEEQERALYNARIESYIGDEIRGSQVKAMITEIISINNSNVGEEGKFIRVDYISNDNSIDTLDLEFACIDAQYDNSQENVDEASDEMKNLSSQISAAKTYEVTSTLEEGIIVKITITEN